MLILQMPCGGLAGLYSGSFRDVRHPGRRWRTSRPGIEPVIGHDRADPFRRLPMRLVAAFRQLACIVGRRFPVPALRALRMDDEKKRKKEFNNHYECEYYLHL
jgi:hypothetical protein